MNAIKNEDDAPLDSRHSTEKGQLIMAISENRHSELERIDKLIKQHEDGLKLLKSQRNVMECTILDLRVALGKYHSSPKAMDPVGIKSEEETSEGILKRFKSAAGVLYQLKAHHHSQTSELSAIKDVLGTVATLGRVDDDHLNRLLSEYLGKDVMLAVVCKTFDGVKALEAYDNYGSKRESSGPLTGRFTVICLEQLRPYHGEYVDIKPQKKLDLLEPRLPNGSPPPGFIGFAVNMINDDTANLSCLTPSGLGLRETLFYSLFSSLQVYQTREQMLEAFPFLTHGAISLDGGILKPTGILMMGDPVKADVSIKFLKSSGVVNLSVNYDQMKERLTEMELKKHNAQREMKVLQLLLDIEKGNFEVKTKEFLMFLDQAASYFVQPKQEQGTEGSSSRPIKLEDEGSSSSRPIKLEDD